MAVALQLVPAGPTTHNSISTYAATRNARYKITQSQFKDLETRLNDVIANLSPQAQANWKTGLANAIRQFKKNHPGLKDFSNRKLFRLPQAVDLALKSIEIDITMQREPDLQWILKIIANFRAYQARPIQVYKTPSGLWGGWDGQHTAIALFLIAVYGLGLDPADVFIPCNVYDITNRGEIRGVFIASNTSTGKNAGVKPLDLIDIWMQMVYGVEIDGVTDPEWVAAHTKQQYIAAAGMFVTATKFQDSHQPGAITRLEEINEASPEVVRQFCVYGKFIVDSQQRPINTKEIPLIIEFLNMCERDQIVYTDAEIRDMALHLVGLFGANFDKDGPYWQQVHQAHINSYNSAHAGLPKHLWPDAPKDLKNVPNGMVFLWHQLRKSWAATKGANFKFPKNSYNVFVPQSGDLW